MTQFNFPGLALDPTHLVSRLHINQCPLSAKSRHSADPILAVFLSLRRRTDLVF